MDGSGSDGELEFVEVTVVVDVMVVAVGGSWSIMRLSKPPDYFNPYRNEKRNHLFFLIGS